MTVRREGESEKCLWNLHGHLLLVDNWFTKWMDPFFGTEEVYDIIGWARKNDFLLS